MVKLFLVCQNLILRGSSDDVDVENFGESNYMKSKPHETKKARWSIIVLTAAARRWQAGKPAVKPRDIVRTYSPAGMHVLLQAITPQCVQGNDYRIWRR